MVFRHTLTTSRKDRDGDVLHPEGMEVDPQLPLLFQHVHTMPIGKMLIVATRNKKTLDLWSCIIDINATFMNITGATYPEEIDGNKTKPPVGRSLLPIFQGQEREPHKEIYWRFNRANAIRQGDLKAIRAGKSWELYDLNADPTEMNNLAKTHPEKTRELASMWERWNKGAVSSK